MRGARWIWPSLAALLPLGPHLGVLTASRVFYVRDLADYFWPHHLWLRRTLAAGELPFWDPGPGLGYAAAADPAVQIFFVPALLFRLLLPAAVGFNVSVALPFPLAGLGLYLFLRTALSAPAACLGALAYALGGPFVSTANCTNLAWCMALLPWALLCAERLMRRGAPRDAALLALVLSAACLAGEPVTFAAGAALVGAWAVRRPRAQEPGSRWKALAGAGVLLALITAVQTVLLVEATTRSIRGGGLLTDNWSLRPLRLWETVLPLVFGDYLAPAAKTGPWLSAVNEGREPYLLSLYLGVPIVLLALRGALDGARRLVAFWSAGALLTLLVALGDYTPVLPALRRLVPLLSSFRYPTKLAVFAALAVAVLAALGFESLAATRRRAAALVPVAAGTTLAAAAAGLIAAMLVAPGTIAAVTRRLAGAAALDDPAAGGRFLLDAMAVQAPRLLVIAGAATLLLRLAGSARADASPARHALLAFAAADLLVAGRGLNPTLETAALAEPPWIAATRERASDRVFIAQDFLATGAPDPDLPPPPPFTADVPVPETLARVGALVPAFPSVWGVREAVSEELTGLRPRETLDVYELYAAADRDARTRFLQRLGVRYHLLPRPPAPGASRRAAVAGLPPMALYELAPTSPRVEIVAEGRLGGPRRRQIARLFEADFDPSREALLETVPTPAGGEGEPRPPRAVIVVDRAQRVEVETDVPSGGGYLVLRDAFDPGWRVDVDAERATLLRANGLLRAVRLHAGRHRVVFCYRPASLQLGMAASAAGVLAAAFALSRRPRAGG